MNPLLLSGIFQVAQGLLDRLFPDPEKKAAAQLEIIKLQQSGELAQLAASTDLAKAQLAVNLEEAKSTNWFIAGGRPFIMWTCGVAFAYATIIEPVARFVAQVVFGYKAAFPVIYTMLTMQVLLGLLGLGYMRTREKEKGVSDVH